MGVFCYKTKGKFPDKFVMEAVDIFLVAKGVSAEVGYKVTPELIMKLDEAGLLEDNISRGLVHSHHNMSTSFSGTDMEQVKLASQSNPYYLSVVVNNKLEFTAKVAVESKEILNGYSYFKTPNNKQVKKAKTYTKNSYEVIDVEVDCHWPEYMLGTDEQLKAMQAYTVPSYQSNWNDDWKYPPVSQRYPSPTTYGVQSSKPNPVITPASLAEDDDDYEMDFKRLSQIVSEINKYPTLSPKGYADFLLKKCDDWGISYDVCWEYVVTENLKDEEFDNKVADYLQAILVTNGE